MFSVSRYVVLFSCAFLVAAPVGAVTLEQLFERPKINTMKISPNGDYLALRIYEDGKHSLLFLDRATQTPLGSLQHHGDSEVGPYFWANNERVVAHVYEFGTSQEAPVNYGELIAGNYDGSRPEIIFGYRSGERRTGSIRKKKSYDYAWGSVIDPLPEDRKNILISSQAMSSSQGRPPVAQLLDVYSGISGKRVHAAKYPGGTFLTGSQGILRLSTGSDENGDIYAEGLAAGSEEWVELDVSSYGSSFQPIAISDDDKSAYVLASVDGDKTGLYRMALDGSGAKLIYGNDQVDITEVHLTPDGRNIYAMRIDKDFPSYLVLSQAHEEAVVFKQLLQLFPGHAITITSDSDDGRFWLVMASSDVDPGTFFLLDRNENTMRPLFQSLPDVDTSELSKVEPIEFESFDGMRIRAYFTPAADAGETPAPMVVLVHGGPRARDYWGFNPEVQALATRGFSVLQVNFRGSSGYGNKFMHAGDRHWGDHVQRDIIAGTRWAIEDGRAVEGKICIMGASFGAYSAVQSATLEPDLYACAVANAGLYDLELAYRKGDIKDFYDGEAYLDEVLGRDETQLRQFSPVNHVAELQIPVFIAHGKSDERTPYQHAKRLMDALDAHDKEYESYVKSREAHGFYDTRNQVEYMEEVLKFLKKHLQ